jgi:uncharacterized protein (DUF2236 family)
MGPKDLFDRIRDGRIYDPLLLLHGKNGKRALEIVDAPRIDDGYFGPGSISWKVYDNIAVAGMGAMSGLFIAVLEPHGGYGVGQHTVYLWDTLGRVRRSLMFFSGAVFGDTATAEKVGRDLFRKHSHVNGVVPSTGEEFRANHVETLMFTYIAGWPHLWRAYKFFGDPNATEEEEREFYAEQHRVGELLGIPSGNLPRTPEAVDAWVREAEQNLMAFTRPAQELRDFVFKPPFTPIWPIGVINPFVRIAAWASVPLMSPYVQEITGLAGHPVRTKVATTLLRAAGKVVKLPLIDRGLLPYFGYETWAYQRNAFLHSPGTGAVPFDDGIGQRLQEGKGGTLQTAGATKPAKRAAKRPASKVTTMSKKSESQAVAR